MPSVIATLLPLSLSKGLWRSGKQWRKTGLGTSIARSPRSSARTGMCPFDGVRGAMSKTKSAPAGALLCVIVRCGFSAGLCGLVLPPRGVFCAVWCCLREWCFVRFGVVSAPCGMVRFCAPPGAVVFGVLTESGVQRYTFSTLWTTLHSRILSSMTSPSSSILPSSSTSTVTSLAE